MKTRVCKVCAAEKPVKEFYISNFNGRDPYVCRKCYQDSGKREKVVKALNFTKMLLTDSHGD